MHPKSYATPGLMLVSPVTTWRNLKHQPTWLAAFIGQCIVVILGSLASYQPVRELSEAAGMIQGNEVGFAHSVYGTILLALALVCLTNLAVIIAISVCLPVLGIRPKLLKILVLASYSLLPFALGGAIGQLLLAFTRVLTNDPGRAIALIIKPFPAGLASVLPDAFPSLSFPWFVTSYIDAFSVWALVCLILGARYYLELSRTRVMWFGLGQVLILIITLTVFWQGTQGLRASLAY